MIEVPTGFFVMLPGFLAALVILVLRVPDKHKGTVAICAGMLALGQMGGMLFGKLLSIPQQQASVETPQEVRDESVQEYLASTVSVPDPDPEPEPLAERSDSALRGRRGSVRDTTALRSLGDLYGYKPDHDNRPDRDRAAGADSTGGEQPDQGRDSERQPDDTGYDLPRTSGQQPGPWRVEREPRREWSERR